MRWLLILSLVTGAPATPTHPGFLDTPRLAAACAAEGPGADSPRSLCLGYVVGAVDQILAAQARRGRQTFCPPADLTAEAAVAAVMRHKRFAGGATGIGAADFVRAALEDAFPCPLARGKR